MWTRKIDERAKKMRDRVDPEQIEAQKEGSRKRAAHARTFRKTNAPALTDQQIETLKRNGAHTSKTAKELGWGPQRAIKLAIELGIIEPEVIKGRAGHSGRPRTRPI